MDWNAECVSNESESASFCSLKPHCINIKWLQLTIMVEGLQFLTTPGKLNKLYYDTYVNKYTSYVATYVDYLR